MHTSVLEFGAREITREMVEGRMVLEVGSLDVNGSLRPHVEQLHPRTYLGVDLQDGPGVDLIEDWCHPKLWFGVTRCQLLICTEMLEHARNWKQVVRNIKAALAPGGWLILTTRSVGFPRHHEPDYWRFSVGDIAWIFRDFEISVLMDDPGRCDEPFARPGVLLKARKPDPWWECDLSQTEVYSMEEEE